MRDAAIGVVKDLAIMVGLALVCLPIILGGAWLLDAHTTSKSERIDRIEQRLDRLESQR